MKRLGNLLWLVVLLLPAVTALAADLIPVPEFSNYTAPTEQIPHYRFAWSDYLDLGFLTVALAAASYFATAGRSRRGLFVVSIVSLVWLGFWRKGCVCPIGAIQNVSQGLFDGSYAVPFTVLAVFSLPLVFTLFFGRSYCASVCPLGAVQEFFTLKPIQVPRALDQALGLLAFVYLGAAVLFAATGTGWIICRYDPFVGLFRLTSSSEMLIVSAVFLVVGIFIGRPYCRWLCPYGAILGLLSRVSRRHLTITPTDCIQCRLCEDACPYGAIVRPTVPQPAIELRRGRHRTLIALGLLPVLIAAGAILGQGLEGPLARMHPTVRLADQIQLEDAGQNVKATVASEAFRASGRSLGELKQHAQDVSATLGRTGLLFGGWVGLVFGVKLVQLSLRRRRTDFEPDRAACVSCGRCFWNCPKEQERQGLVQLTPPANATTP